MYVFRRQIIFAVLGIAVLLLVAHIPVGVFRRWSLILLAASVALLALVLAMGMVGFGSRRWISLGFTTFQPSELTKLALILGFSTMICKYGNRKMKTFRYGVFPFVLIMGIIVVLLALEPHFSAAVIIMALGVVMMFAGGTRLRWFALAAALAAVLLLIAYHAFPYVQERVTAYLHPENDPTDTGLQIIQSILAIGSGGLTGLGLGQSRQKFMYLPEEHNDYIFAIICEELGFIGAVLILILFALLICRCFWIALHAKTKYGALVVIGVTGHLAIQVFLNVAVVTHLIPATGISLPFFSYGGTALLLTMVEMGIVLAVSREVPMPEEAEEALP
jgi:cell division protein FtsW